MNELSNIIEALAEYICEAMGATDFTECQPLLYFTSSDPFLEFIANSLLVAFVYVLLVCGVFLLVGFLLKDDLDENYLFEDENDLFRGDSE